MIIYCFPAQDELGTCRTTFWPMEFVMAHTNPSGSTFLSLHRHILIHKRDTREELMLLACNLVFLAACASETAL